MSTEETIVEIDGLILKTGQNPAHGESPWYADLTGRISGYGSVEATEDDAIYLALRFAHERLNEIAAELRRRRDR